MQTHRHRNVTGMSLRLAADSQGLAALFYSLERPSQIADLLEVDYGTLTYHVYRTSDQERYAEFRLPKRSGGERIIRAPANALRIIQRKLNQVLSAVYAPKASAHGFVEGRSIVTNAQQHKRKHWVLNLDLEDFFPSINFGRVRGLFRGIPYSRNEKVATVLAQICCFKNQLPQGAPTSPVVSNMICAKLDSKLRRLAERNRCDYTRYADDITFSTATTQFPKELAQIKERGGESFLALGKELRQVIETNGFSVNENKVRLQTDDRRQEVTGLTVNRFPNVRRRFYRQVRAMLHAWETHGYESAQEEFRARYDKKHRSATRDEPTFRRVVRGKLEFIRMVRGDGSSLCEQLFDKYFELTRQSPHDGVFVLECDATHVQGTGFFLKGYGLISCAHVLGPNTAAYSADALTKLPVEASSLQER